MYNLWDVRDGLDRPLSPAAATDLHQDSAATHSGSSGREGGEVREGAREFFGQHRKSFP